MLQISEYKLMSLLLTLQVIMTNGIASQSWENTFPKNAKHKRNRIDFYMTKFIGNEIEFN